MAVFADLPAELRIQIWELCVLLSVEPGVFVWGTGIIRKADDNNLYCEKQIPFPRVRKQRYPLVTNTCRESRHHLLSQSIADRYHIGRDHRPLDPDVDIIFLRWPAHLHRMRMVIKLAIKYGNPTPWPARVTRLALSQECADLCNNVLFGTEFERWRLFETLLCQHHQHHQQQHDQHDQRPQQRTLKEVSLVCVDSEVDLDVPDPWVVLADWTPARATTVQERDAVQAMRAVLVKELDMADRAWACRPHRPVDPGWVAPPEDMDRTALCVKRMVKPGLLVARRETSHRGRRDSLKLKMAGLARWWVRQSQTSR